MPKEKTKQDARSAMGEATRNDILDVATREFSDKGYAGARVDEIAEKTAASKRMIYYYFGGKDGLYLAVLERAYAGIRDRETAQDFDAMPAVDALRAIVEHTFDYHIDHPEFVRLVMNENILQGAHIGKVDGIRTRNRSVITALRKIIDKGVDEGVFRDNADPLGLHLTISALCFHYSSNQYTLREIFGIDLTSRATRSKRREDVVEVVLAWVQR